MCGGLRVRVRQPVDGTRRAFSSGVVKHEVARGKAAALRSEAEKPQLNETRLRTPAYP